MAVLVDTHVLLWTLDGTLPERSQRASREVVRALVARELQVSIGSFLDLRYLLDGGRLDDATVRQIERAVMGSSMTVIPLDLDVHHAMGRLSREQVPDPFDRIIAATSLLRRVPLVTADRRIRRALGPRAVW